MNNEQRRRSKAAKEPETVTEEQEQKHREHEVMLQKDGGFQNVQTGTSDARHPGINWGSSTTRRKASSSGRKQRANDGTDRKTDRTSRS